MECFKYFRLCNIVLDYWNKQSKLTALMCTWESFILKVVIEGISWIFQQYYPVQPKDQAKRDDISAFGKGRTDFFDVLKEIREDTHERRDA